MDDAVPILVEALDELTGIKPVPGLSPDALMDRYCPTFNHSTMVFLPKTPVPGSPSDSPVFYPSAVRPLNISNADNRILASAVRIAVEPRLGPLITNRQRGFIQGRSMIANLLDVEEGMYTAAATGSGGLSFFLILKPPSRPWNMTAFTAISLTLDGRPGCSNSSNAFTGETFVKFLSAVVCMPVSAAFGKAVH